MTIDTGFLLGDAGAQADAVAEVDVDHAQTDEIAATSLAVDGGVEQGEVARAALVLQAGADRPDVLRLEWRLEWRLGADEATEVSGLAVAVASGRRDETPFETPSASHRDPSAPWLRAMN